MKQEKLDLAEEVKSQLLSVSEEMLHLAEKIGEHGEELTTEELALARLSYLPIIDKMLHHVKMQFLTGNECQDTIQEIVFIQKNLS